MSGPALLGMPGSERLENLSLSFDTREANQNKRLTNEQAKQELHSKYSDVFLGIVCFKVTFFLQLKEGVKPFQAAHRSVAYAPQKPFKKLKGLQQHK